MGAKTAEKTEKKEFKEWFTQIIELAMDTRKGFTPETLKQFEEHPHRAATPRRSVETAVAVKVPHEGMMDPELEKLLKKNPNAIIAAEGLGTLLTDNVNGKKFKYKSWVEA